MDNTNEQSLSVKNNALRQHQQAATIILPMKSIENEIILRIAVATPLYSLFDYLPPSDVDLETLTPGVRVEIPFAKSKRFGILIETSQESELPRERLRRAIRCIDTDVMPQELLALCRWAADYYHHPLGEVLATALPTLLRRGQDVGDAVVTHWSLTQAGQDCQIESLSRAPRQLTLMRLFQQAAGFMLSRTQLQACDFSWQPVLKILIDKQWVQACETSASTELKMPHLSLNTDQQNAVEHIRQKLGGFSSFLLEGVTGSGKTEVYFESMQAALNENKQCVLLVPEIGLTPQLSQRLQQRFHYNFVSYHSGLNDSERARAWRDAASGKAKIIVGTRSAVFLPLANPGLIIVDEEHDLSFKQQDGFRYHARDIAIRRAQQLKIPIVLGSATPSLESSENVRNKRYQWLHLPERGGKAIPPTVALIDMRRQALKGALSPMLIAHMQATLAKGEQILLFVNRRGYAPALLCHDCGWIAKCQRCDANMTVHHAKHCLRCHHCGSQRRLDKRCGDCQSEELTTLGFGTEQIEDTLTQLFPYQKIIRIDRDTTQKKGSMDKLLNQIEEGQGDILVGTQMIAKGHHLPNVTLAAILNADQGLFATDFRALEHLAQLVVQVTGRAGRGDKAGHVLIQTHHPEHPLLQTLIKEGYRRFSEQLVDERKSAELPPFSYMALLRAEAVDEASPMQFLQSAKEQAELIADNTTLLLGPIPAPMARRAGRYRAQLLLQANDRRSLHALLYQWVRQLSSIPLARKVRWSVDVDPMDMN